MKPLSKAFYAVLICTAVTIPVVGHSITLSSGLKTPCFFGAMGSAASCMAARKNTTVSTGFTAVAPVAPAQPTISTAAVNGKAPSAVIAATSTTTTAIAPQVSQVQAVPLPLAGGLLAGSLGLMLLANRKRRNR